MQARDTIQDSSAQRAPARSWRAAIAFAAAALYLPQLLPLALTDLLEHGHCLDIYLRHFLVLAGLLPGLQARFAADLGGTAEEVLTLGVATAVTLAVLALVALALRRWRRSGVLVALAVAVLSGWMAMGAVAFIRA